MTCIVGLIDRVNDKILLGGDSAGVSGFNVYLRKDPKVFKRDNFIFGFTSSFRMGQLLMTEGLIRREQREGEDTYKYMVSEFIPNVRKVFRDNGYSSISDNEETGGIFLVGCNKRLFFIDTDFQVGEYHDDYMCCGCGQAYAYGSLYSTNDIKITSYDRIIKALEAAEHFSCGVRRPFTIVTL